METIGPKVTKVDIKLNSVSLSLLSGGGAIKGLVVGNPTGFKTPYAINVGEASLALALKSLLSDKIIVKSIKVQGPEITYETNLKDSNLSKIVANMQGAAGGGQKEPAQPKEGKPAKKLQVDEFIITGGKIHVSRDRPEWGNSDSPAAGHSPPGSRHRARWHYARGTCDQGDRAD